MKAIELFAGIGGISLAMEWAGIETIAFCEREPFCQKVLKKHWSDVPIFDDVFELNREVLEESGVIERGGTVDIISGGFPCQPFSVAGKRKGTADDRDLWPQMFRLIQEIRPRWVVGENVANFANMELDRTLSNLESEGYETQAFIVPACAVGAPHRRDRCFIVAHAQGERCGETGRNSERSSEWTAGSCSLGNPDRCGCEGKHGGSKSPQPANRRQDVSNTECTRLERFNQQSSSVCRKNERAQPWTSSSRFETIPDTSGLGHGQVEQQDGGGTSSEGKRGEIGERCFRFRRPESQWAVEPDVGRVAHGIPRRVDRLRSLGNAVVPQQIYPIFEAIAKIG